MMYIYDSMNIGETKNAVKQAVAEKLKQHQVKFLHYKYHARNDFCGSNLVAATIELVRWYQKGLVPLSIQPSPSVRARIEKRLHKYTSSRDGDFELHRTAHLRRIRCLTCGKSIRRKGSNLHERACGGK